MAPSLDVSFPHAAMATPAITNAPWLQSLTSALESLDRGHSVRGERPHNRKQLKHSYLHGLPKGDEVEPRFVCPVWESLSQPPQDAANGDTQEISVAVDKGVEDYVVGGGGCWLLRSKSKTTKF